MKTILIFFCTLFLCTPLYLSAQKFSLRGTLVDTAAAPLEGSTVMLLSPRDTSLLAFTRSGAGGLFEFRSLNAGNYLLRASYPGLRNYQQNVPLDGNPRPVDLGQLALTGGLNIIDGVEITAEANPVAIKGDTVEYNAGSFKVKQNAVVEDLLKKLPGVEVKSDGTITAMGETVQNVTVDGKKFFSNDPKIATKNLPADAVNKVQVFDKKSEQAQFSGVDDGQREKTINLELKEDRKNGWFGTLTGGGGLDAEEKARYEGRLSLNRFTPKQQLSFLGLGNNINQAGFSIEDYMAFSGAMRQMMGGGGGRVTLQFDSDNMTVPLDFGNNEGFLNTWAGGVNFNQEYGSKYKGDLNASYMFTQADKNYDRTIQRNNFLPQGDYQTSSTSAENNSLQNHRLNLSLDQKVDSFNSVLITSAISYGDNSAQTLGQSRTFGAEGELQNTGDRRYLSDATGTNWTGGVLWRHKFAKKGRNFTVNLDGGLNRSESVSTSFSDNQFIRGNTTVRDTIAQDQYFTNDETSLSAKGTYTEPLGQRRYLEFSYAYSLTQNNADKDVFDLDGGENTFNPLLSNAYENRFDYQRGGAGFRINRKSWNGSVGLDYQYAVLDGAVTSGQGQPVRETFRHVLPRLDYNYQFAPTRNLRVFYQTRVSPPSVQQLQPVPDLSDPLNIRDGNPDLNPEYAHSIQTNYMSFNPENMRSFFTNLSFDYTQDKIVYAQSVDSQFVRHYRPENTAANYRLFGMTSFGWRFKALKSRLNLNTQGSWNRGQGLVNNVTNYTTGIALTQGASLDFNPADWFSLNAGAELTWNQSRYSIDQSFNQEFLTQTYTSELNLDLPADFAFNTSLNVAVNTGRADGFNTTIPIWNAEFSHSFLKNKRLQVGLSVRDLLNRNQGLHRSANLNYVEDERVASLGRTVMLRATYSLNSFGPGGPGGGPRMRMLIRR
ncbi:MAG: TonB-dependent receptor [Saprospiraceae bacterium]|nr:TonB-dependent receptor [Saprospiraceae bacterium]